MSDTTVGSPVGLAGGVAAYVREVRSELADLPDEDVDDLTGGMEADLSELAAESGGDLVGRLGSPSLYAAELRAAAGLPERAPASGRRRRSLGEQVALDRASFTSLIARHPWLQSVTAFLVALRPAWWLVRGYLAAWALWSMLGDSRGVRPHSFLELVMAFAAIVISVQIGRGWLRQRKLSRPLLAMANSTLVVAALVASVSGGGSYYYTSTYTPPPGVSLNGAQVGNIYAYDSDGNRITGVRLFAQDGRPLDGEQSLFDASGNPIGVIQDSSGASLMNVYPRALVGSDPWQVTDPANQQWGQQVWTPPMSIVPLIPSATATATQTPTTTATATATATATPTAPTATATAPAPTARATATAPRATAPTATATPTATSQRVPPRPSSPTTP